MKDFPIVHRFFGTTTALVPILLLVCSFSEPLYSPALLQMPPPGQCACGEVTFDVNIAHLIPTKKVGNVQNYDVKQETVAVKSTSTSNTNTDKPQKIAPKNLGPTKKGDKVGISLSNFKADCPCVGNQATEGTCHAYPMPAGNITATTLQAYVNRIEALQKKIAEIGKKIGEIQTKIEELKKKAADKTTSEQEKKRIAKEIEKLQKEIEKKNGEIDKLKEQLRSGPPSVLGGDFKHAKTETDDKGNVNLGQFDVNAPPFKHEFVIGYVCYSLDCGKAVACYKKFVVEF